MRRCESRVTDLSARGRILVMSQLQAAPNVLSQLLEPVGRMMPLEFAKGLVELRASPEVQGRIDELAEKSNEGLLTAGEKAEYEAYVDAIDVISILQAKARGALLQHANR